MSKPKIIRRPIVRFSHVPEMVAPQIISGIDFGSRGRVIATCGRSQLVWRKGNTGWSGRGQTSYYRAHLHVVSPATPQGLWEYARDIAGDTIAPSGFRRLCLAMIEKHLPEIRLAMGLNNSLQLAHFRLGMTLLIECDQVNTSENR